jgi:hypothetical protein
MKKIIYSLVIMIAAGSLFTSCIDQVEPVGILDMRSAKAEYIRALKDLRAADAEFRRAEAALKQADARYRDAETAWMNAQTENQNLLNELQALLNEAQAMENELRAAQIADEIARMEMKMEEDAKQHEINMLDLEQNLQQAAEDLRVALRNIALHSQDLTNDEKLAVAEAVAVYEGIFEVYQKQVVKVKEARAYLDSLQQWKQRFADKGWDSDNHQYAYKVNLWQREINRATTRIEKGKALLEEVPSPDEIDMNEWNAELEAMQAEIDALKYNFNTTTVKDIAEYYVNNVHDGVKAFNDAVTVFLAQFDGYNLNPLTKAEEALIKAGEKKQEDFKQQMADSIQFAKLAKGKISAPTFNKFAYLLKSYKQESPISKADPKNNIMAPANDTIKIVMANQSMKDFILGKAGNGENSQEYKWTDKNKVEHTIYANYGLWGAYDILERELVTKQKEAASPEKIKELKDAEHKADSVWKAHRQILIDGLAKYKPYTDAIAKYEAAVKENNTGASAMVEAIDALTEQINIVADHTSWSLNDSTAIFNALVAFAKARESYLDLTAKQIKEKFGENADPRYYHYTTASAPVVIDSVKFSELKFAGFQKVEDRGAAGKDGAYAFNNLTNGTRKYSTTVDHNAFAAVMEQLFGAEMVNKVKNATVTKIAAADMETVFNDGTNYTPLYTLYKYVAGDPAKIVNLDGTPYVPKNVSTAKDAVKAAVNDYIDVYNSFWAQSVAAAGTEYDAYFAAVEADPTATKKIADEKKKAEKAITDLLDSDLDPKSYTLATFKPYADEAPIVTFTGANIDETDAILAILTGVDPKCTDREDNEFYKGNISGSAIFKDNKTDFYKYMKAAYELWAATNEEITNELAAIKAWIEGVEKTFAADAEKTGKDDEDAFKAWKKAYKAATDHAADLIEFIAALAEFTGVDEEGEPNGIVMILGSYDDPDSITPNNWFELLNKNVLGDCDGWIENLGGAQLALAEELFPDFPEVFQGWKEAIEEYNDEKAHLEILMDSFKAAYYAAAKAAGYDQFNNAGKGAADWDALYKAYKEAREAYVNKIKAQIKEQTEIIDTYSKKIADYWSEIPTIDIEIADAQANLVIEQHRLTALEQALALAKANMEKILEYVQSQDANFVLLNAYANNTAVDAEALAAALDALKSLGISIPGVI